MAIDDHYAQHHTLGMSDHQLSTTQQNLPTALMSSPSRARSLLTREITTTYDDSSGSYGNMFDVVAKTDISISRLEFHCDIDFPVTYEIYSIDGGYLRCRGKRACWGDPVASGDVGGEGRDKPTPLPPFLKSVSISENQTRAFYITLTTPDIRYSNGVEQDAVFVENDDMQILTGIGIGRYPLQRKSFFENRMWNGIIHYEVNIGPTETPTLTQSMSPSGLPSSTPTSTPSGSPSLIPTASPTTKTPSVSPTALPSARPSLSNMLPKTLTTSKSGGLEGTGNIFDVQALDELSITGMDLLTKSKENITLAIWTKPGTHEGFETNMDAWTMICNYTVKGNGTDGVTAVPHELFTPIRLRPNNTQAFYVSLSTEDLLYSMGDANFAISNADLQIKDGSSISGAPFGEEFFKPRRWNGVLHYLSQGQAAFLTDGELNLEHTAKTGLSTVTRFTLIGDVTEMDLSQSIFFEKATSGFLDELLAKSDPPINVNHVAIKGQSIAGQGRTHQARRSGVYFSSDTFSSITIDATITGEYLPPPEVNFDNVVEDSISEESENFMAKLKENDHFSKLTGVAAVSLSHEVPTQSPTAIGKPELSCTGMCKHSGTFYILSGVLFLLVAVGFTVRYWVQSKKSKQRQSTLMNFDVSALNELQGFYPDSVRGC